MERKEFDEITAAKFPGDEDLAQQVLTELSKIEKSINNISNMVESNIGKENAKYIKRSISNSYGELMTEVKMPIYTKFPNLKGADLGDLFD